MLSRIHDVLRTIPDPEMPISIVDLGLVETVRVEPEADGADEEDGARVSIDILPTFVGCPALDMIRGDIEAKVGALEGVRSVEVHFLHDPPWTVDRISDAGRRALAEHGVSVPERRGEHRVELRASAVPCPFCGARSTTLESPFGPTRCRMIYYCNDCGNGFERMKRV